MDRSILAPTNFLQTNVVGTITLMEATIINALQDMPISLYGSGKNVREWLCVDDHCNAIDQIIQNGRVGEVYNIGGENERPNDDVVKTILGILGKSEELIQYVPDRSGHDYRYALDYTKIKNEIGWTAQVSFDDGIQKTVHWYIKHKDWWKSIIAGDYIKNNDTLYEKIRGYSGV